VGCCLKTFFRDLTEAIGQYIRYVDKTLLFLCALTTAYGIVLIYSATYSFETLQYVKTQTLAAVIGIAVYLFAACINIEWITKHWGFLLAANLILIGSLYFFASGENNSNWIYIKKIGLSFQPAEIGKVIFILTFARHLYSCSDEVSSVKNVFLLLLHVGITAGAVILFSKDDGMTLAYLFIALIMAFAAGIRYRWFLAGGITAAAAIPLLWTYFLDEYQKLRILVVLDPTIDPAKAYQANQSKIALSSGLLTGKGFLQGTQTQYSLIPTKHTDSIFAVAGEEFGFVGTFAIILLLTFIILRCFYCAARSVDSPSGSIAVGLGAMLIFQTLLNIGMNMGILPIIGLTLPFISYGGTSLVTMYAAMGIVAGIRMREKRDRRRQRESSFSRSVYN